jgi:hypothetical protein
VTQGLARLFRFPSNILAVFFSDVAVMDARAVNARTVAITGLAPGASTLAVFTERYPGDAVGRSHIYQIAVRPPHPALLRRLRWCRSAIRRMSKPPSVLRWTTPRWGFGHPDARPQSGCALDWFCAQRG